jgi:hypothetical protein
MLSLPAGREASLGFGAFVYERHRPERTLLYQLIQEYHPVLKAYLAAQGTALPGYVEREFEDYLRCRPGRAKRRPVVPGRRRYGRIFAVAEGVFP